MTQNALHLNIITRLLAAGGNATCFHPFLEPSTGEQEYWHQLLNYVILDVDTILPVLSF
jgi:hypothetical protein